MKEPTLDAYERGLAAGRVTTEERAALAELLSIIKHGDAPHYPDLPQTDLASTYYVRLATKVEEVCERLGIEPE